jgi:hypothetical protein
VTDRDAEVPELENAVDTEKEVLGLHVAVDETGGVGGSESCAGLHAEPCRLRGRQRAAPRRELGDGLPLDVLHRDERTAFVLPDAEDADDVRVREPCRQAGLTEKPPPQVLVAREVLGEPLERHRPVELDVAGEVDGRHRSVTQRTHELVAAQHARRRAHRWSPFSPPCPWPLCW